MTLRRIALVNRGEAAMRLLRAVQELNDERGLALETVLLYTTADASNLVVQEASEAICIGEPTYLTDDGQRRSSYLDYPRLSRALREARADAAWVGWGFAAEDPVFAELCDELGVTFIGPRPEVMRQLADKVASKRLAESVGIPVTPWSGGVVESVGEACEVAERIGYPLVIKASAGGGGRGIRRVDEAAGIEDAFVRARSEAAKAFGSADVFIERLVSEARHVEVQIIGDAHGTVWALGARDCSVQRRHQKVIEEGPPPTLDGDERGRLFEAAVKLTRAAGYTNAGTVEFLFDDRTRELYFMEMNTRLQVEHPVTEVATGVDLVKLQLHVAGGGALPSAEPPASRGHAIEVRLNAEDVAAGFAPAPGRISAFRAPGGAGVRVDSGYFAGDVIPADFDSMVAKIIAYGATREEARARARRALRETTLAIDGGICNKAFLLELLGHQDFIDSRIDTRWLDRLLQQGAQRLREGADVALCRAALALYAADHVAERAQFIASTARGRPRTRQEVGLPLELRYGGETYKLVVHCLGPGRYGIDIAGDRIVAELDERTPGESWLTLGARRYHTLLQRVGLDFLVEVDGAPHRVLSDDGGAVRAAGPGLVVAVDVEEGQVVRTGDRLLVLEAMKMELPLLAPGDGRVRGLRARVGSQVDVGSTLMVIEPLPQGDGDGDGADARRGSGTAAQRVSFRSSAKADDGQTLQRGDDYPQLLRERYRRDVRALLPFMLGFDVRRVEVRGLRRELEALQAELDPEDAETAALEIDVIDAFVDLVSLYAGSAPTAHGISELMQAYVRALDDRARSLPEHFVERLERVLARYGVRSLERSAALEDALYWSYRAYSRISQVVPVIGSILERWLRADKMPRALVSGAVAEALARLRTVSQGLYSELHELTLQARYRLFDQPLLDRERERVYAGVQRELERLTSASRPPSSEERERLVALLVSCPQPLTGLLSPWLRRVSDDARELLLECLVRRFYAARRLEGARSFRDALDGCTQSVVGFSARYAATRSSKLGADRIGERGDVAVCAVACLWTDLGGALLTLARAGAEHPQAEALVLEVFVDVTDADNFSYEHLAELIAKADFDARVARVCVCVTSAELHRARDYATFVRSAEHRGRLLEVRQQRGIHAMWAARLELWRLRQFEIERQRSGADIYLFVGKARDNARDQRLFAFTDVRDLTPRQHPTSGEVSLPSFERMFRHTMAAMRNAQHSSARRLLWNRVLFYFWQDLPFELERLYEIVRRLVPETRGLGLERIAVRLRGQPVGGNPARWYTVDFAVGDGVVVDVRVRQPDQSPLRSLSPYEQRVVRCRARGLAFPYEIVKMLAPRVAGSSVLFPRGEFVEHDLDASGERLVPVDRPPGENQANVVVGVIKNFTPRHPEGMARVAIFGDPTREMGALAEPECRRLVAALDLAAQLGVPVDWFPVSAGAKISLVSGTENLDWTARVLRRLIEFCGEGEVNVVVAAINVGAQSYFNAEATMLMHTSGILVMTEQAAMVLTGKRALDYSGSVSAEDHLGIGGAERIMALNGQAQYVCRDLTGACLTLMAHYELTYVQPGEHFARRLETVDDAGRDICRSPHEGEGFATVGDIFGEANSHRKRPFDIRSVMRAVADVDHPALERWARMKDAETAVVWDVALGGWPVSLIGIESKPIPRLGPVAGDGPAVAAAGALMPLSSKKLARAINAASGRRPVVLLANLSGFDGSPESLRSLQLEYGAEIGRAVVNFDGPILFTVISRYHGGAYVVFSRALNENLRAIALEGAYASVIGGAPAAAVVLTRHVRKRALADPQIVALTERLEEAEAAERPALHAELHARIEAAMLAEQARVAHEFDTIHSVERACQVGSLDEIVAPSALRPRLVALLDEMLGAAAPTKSH